MTVRLIYSYERPSCDPFIIILGLVTPQSGLLVEELGDIPPLLVRFS